MLTVKLYGKNANGVHATKIMTGHTVDVFRLRPRELIEISVEVEGGSNHAFYISDPDKPRPGGFADEVMFWDVAFVENRHGATTETVRANS